MKQDTCSYCGSEYHQLYDDGLVECRQWVANQRDDAQDERDALRAQLEAMTKRAEEAERSDMESLEMYRRVRADRDIWRKTAAELRAQLEAMTKRAEEAEARLPVDGSHMPSQDTPVLLALLRAELKRLRDGLRGRVEHHQLVADEELIPSPPGKKP